MKIVKQSFEILPEHGDPIQQIASRARICYKSEDKAQEDERPFLTRIREHEPIFEMAVISLVFHSASDDLDENLKAAKYLETSFLDGEMTLVTGSIRAWQEWLITNTLDNTYDAWLILHEHNDFLFSENTKPIIGDIDPSITTVEVVDINNLKLCDEAFKKHNFVAVKFITNRAVSHELVRHRPCAFLQESQRYCRYKNEVVFIDPRPAFDFYKDHAEFTVWEDDMSDCEKSYLDVLVAGGSPQAARVKLPNSCKTEIIVYCNLREWEHILNRRTSGAAEPSMKEQMIPLYAKFQKLFGSMMENPQLSVG